VAVGEYERAFYGDQLRHLATVFERHGMQLWLPEVHGRVNHRDPTHQALMMLLGAQSRREVLRSRFRTMAAMQAQAREQGRYLGGRPPYGNRLVDAGPHPNAAHAVWGRRLRRLEPNPATAPTVAWTFQQRLAGQAVAAIARALNEQGVPCPSIMDAGRNRHRTHDEWSPRTVAAILANPRYTGRQVWNRQRTDHDTPHDQSGPGRGKVLRWNTADQWVVSKQLAHPALVSEADSVAAQRVNASPTPAGGGSDRYLLVGLVRCGLCQRRMDSHWVHDRAGYRCRHGHTAANPRRTRRPKTLYRREDQILERVRAALGDHPDLGHRPRAIAEHLRDNNLTVICTARTVTIDTPARHAAQQTLIMRAEAAPAMPDLQNRTPTRNPWGSTCRSRTRTKTQRGPELSGTVTPVVPG
jgi:site-specific DNA recombinase